MEKKDVVYGEIRGTGQFRDEAVDFEGQAVMMVAITQDPESAEHKAVQFSITGSASEKDLVVMVTGILTALTESVGKDMAEKIVKFALNDVDNFRRQGGRV